MLSKNDLYKFIDDPLSINSDNCEDLKKLTEVFPFCEILHWLYLRALFINNDALFEDELLKHGMYISNRKLFYEFITFEGNPENKEKEIVFDNVLNLTSMNYFEIEKNQNQKHSLQDLAEKLKMARLNRQKMMNSNINHKENNIHDDEISYKNKDLLVQNLIKEHKYSDALEILRSINLNNPKKSVYFALQIKYLETIINNNNKIN